MGIFIFINIYYSVYYRNWSIMCSSVHLMTSILMFRRCMCEPGYTGQNCESKYVPCDPSPCQNGGVCRELDNLNYECECQSGKNWQTKAPKQIEAKGLFSLFLELDLDKYFQVIEFIFKAEIYFVEKLPSYPRNISHCVSLEFRLESLRVEFKYLYVW